MSSELRPSVLAIAEREGFRFLASDPEFVLLDGSRFRRLEQVEQAARRLARFVSERESEATMGCSASPCPAAIGSILAHRFAERRLR